MRNIIVGALTTIAIGATLVTLIVISGSIDPGADTPHSPAVFRALELARETAVARRAAQVAVPNDLTDPERVRRGAGNYAAMCVSCHLAPAMPDSEIRQGLYPQPPNLAAPASAKPSDQAAARRFWIIKHGIKASAMPAWSKGGMDDAAIWDLVAFLATLPALDKTQYDQLVASSDGHSHAATEGHGQNADGHGDRSPPLPGKPTAAHHDDRPHRH